MENYVASKFIKVDTSEKRFEADIEAAFLSRGYRNIDRNDYNAENMVFPNILTEFMQTSQPREWADMRNTMVTRLKKS